MRPYVIVDVFTQTPLEGNPLAVYTDAEGLPGERMQQVAREMNLSETVFVLPAEAGGDARIRIFTPLAELPFAGHPTLGCAFVLCGQRGLGAITLETGAGPTAVTRAGTGTGTGTGTGAGAGTRAANGQHILPHPPILPGYMLQPVPPWEPYDRAAELLEIGRASCRERV